MILPSEYFAQEFTKFGLRLRAIGLASENQRRYNISVTFETFPFPIGLTPNIPASNYTEDPRAIRIAAAAKRLNELREPIGRRGCRYFIYFFGYFVEALFNRILTPLPSRNEVTAQKRSEEGRGQNDSNLYGPHLRHNYFCDARMASAR